MAEPTAPPLERAVRPARWLLLGLTVAVLLILFWPTRPAGGDQAGLALWLTQQHARGQLRWLTFGLIEFVSNMVMFAPLGALAACSGLSVFAELVQWSVLPNRTGDVRDVVANTLGAAIGIGIVALIRT